MIMSFDIRVFFILEEIKMRVIEIW